MNFGKLQRLQNMCVRFVTGASRFEHITPYYHQLGLMKLEQKQVLALALMVAKIVKFQSPRYLFDRFNLVSNARSTRSNKLQFMVPRYRTNKFGNSFTVQACKIWNKLSMSDFNHYSIQTQKKIIQNLIAV